MKYDPIKNVFANLIENNAFFRKSFYLTLQLIILRQWHVKKEIKALHNKKDTFTFYDAGAGFCQYSDFILSYFPNASVIAMDLKTDYMLSFQNYLKRKGINKISIYQGDLQSFIPQKKADIAIAIDILEHIQNDRQVLKNIYNSLNHNSHLIISTPSNLDKAAAFTEEHVRPGYAMEDLIEKVQTAGFKVKTVKYSYGFWGKIYWILGMKIPLTMTSLSKLFLIILPIYFLFVIPFNLVFMYLDMIIHNKKGNGLILVAEKE